MKLLLAFLGIAGSAAIGYLFEPQLRPAITGQKSNKKMTSKVSATQSSGSTISSPDVTQQEPPAPPAATLDYNALLPSQLPAKVTLNTSATASSSDQEVITVSPGTKVSPVRIEADILFFRLLGAVEGKIPVSQTNLVELLASNPPIPPPTQPEKQPAPAEPEPAPAEPEPAPAEPEPAPAEPEPAPVEPEPAPAEPEPAPAEPEPAPMPADPAPAATGKLSAEGVITLMKQHISQGKIKEFTTDQVTDWKSADDELIDGQNYQIGIASYQAESIFGTRVFQAKALIKDGAVSRWISPTSGLEIE